MHSEHIISTNRRQPKAYSPKQLQILGRHMSDPDGLRRRETLTGGVVFVRRGSQDPFPGRTNADIFGSIGASALRSGSAMSIDDSALFDGIRLRSWGRIELETYRFAYQPTWFAAWLRRVVADAIPGKRVSRSMCEFAWGFFAAERSEALTMVTYDEFAAYYGVARSTVGAWLQVLRQARVIESAHTWAEDNGKTSHRRPLAHKHPRCYATNLYRLGTAVADDVRIAIREGRSDARFCSGKSMAAAARNCGRALRTEMRAESQERRDLYWARRNGREPAPAASSNCRPIFGPLRPSVPSGSITPPRDGVGREIKALPPVAPILASLARTTNPATPRPTEPRTPTVASGHEGEHDAKRASSFETQKKTSSVQPVETSTHRNDDYEMRFNELAEMGLAHIRRALHVILAVLLVSATACGNWISHATDNAHQYQRFGGLGAQPGAPRTPHDPGRSGQVRNCAFERRPGHVPATRPGESTPRRCYANVDDDGDPENAKPNHGCPLVPKEKIMTETTEYDQTGWTRVEGTVEATPGKHVIAALATNSDHVVFRWKLDHQYVVRVTKISGYGENDEKINARIRIVHVGENVYRRVPGRVGPGEFSVVMTSANAKSMSIALHCTPVTT